MSIRDLFNEEDIDIILEAFYHRAKYYKNKIKQQEIDASCGTTRQAHTLERYIAREKRLNQIASIVAEESN